MTDAAIDLDDSAITMAVGRAGYVGVARLDESRWVLGASLEKGAVQAAGGEAAAMAILAEAGVAVSARTAWRGVPALSRRRASVESAGRVFVVGDATGYVEPFTGQGMSWALRGAEAITPSIESAVMGSYREGVWERDLRRMPQRDQRGCRIVAAVLRRPRACGAAVAVAGWFPDVASRCASVIAGQDAAAAGAIA